MRPEHGAAGRRHRREFEEVLGLDHACGLLKHHTGLLGPALLPTETLTRTRQGPHSHPEAR